MLHGHTCKSIQLTEQETRWTITSWMYFLVIGDNLLIACLFLCCFLKSDFYFPNWCTDPPNIDKFQTDYFVGVQQSVTLNCEAEGNPPPTYTWIPCDSDQVCDKNTLHTSQVFNDANYICRVANALGVDSKTANICKSHVHCIHALNFESKSSLWYDRATDLIFPYIILLHYKIIFKILPDCLSCSYLETRTTTQFFILQAINTIHQWEMCREFDQCLRSYRLLQKLQLLL